MSWNNFFETGFYLALWAIIAWVVWRVVILEFGYRLFFEWPNSDTKWIRYLSRTAKCFVWVIVMACAVALLHYLLWFFNISG